VRRWNDVYRSLWEANDRYADLEDWVAALDTAIDDRATLQRGLEAVTQALLQWRDGLELVRGAIRCFPEWDTGRAAMPMWPGRQN